MSVFTVPTLRDVFLARRVVEKYLPRTPLFSYQPLNELLGCEVFIKHENHQPIGAFKVRGGVTLIANLSQDEKRKGVISASTGNHGLSIAYGARLFGVQCVIVAPEGANPAKVAAMQSLGADVIFHGQDFDDARQHAEHLSRQRGHRFVHTANEPLLIAGVGTLTLEILENQPDIDVVIVPVGGGSCVSGCAIVAKSADPSIEVIAVQAEKAPAAYLTWKNKEPTEAGMETFAEGLATRVPFELTQEIMQRHLDDFVLVGEEEMREAMLIYLDQTRNLIEAAGAASLAAALKIRERLAGKRVALVASGGNISRDQLRSLLNS